MADEITVINRTETDCVFMVGVNDPTTNNFANGHVASGWVQPGASSGVIVSGSGPFMVGVSPNPVHGSAPSVNSPYIMAYQVFPGSMVTFASQVGTRPDAQPTDVEPESGA